MKNLGQKRWDRVFSGNKNDRLELSALACERYPDRYPDSPSEFFLGTAIPLSVTKFADLSCMSFIITGS